MGKTILCDIDSVVADLLRPWLATYNAERGHHIQVCDITDWNTGKCVPDGAVVFEIIDRPGFFEGLPLLPGASDGLKALIGQGHEVYLVSAASAGALSEKSRWVRKHLPFMRDRLFLTDGKTPKGLIRGDVLIDDGPHNLIDFKKRNPKGIAIACDYPYTAPARSISDLVVPFHEDSAAGWKAITEYLLAGLAESCEASNG